MSCYQMIKFRTNFNKTTQNLNFLFTVNILFTKFALAVNRSTK